MMKTCTKCRQLKELTEFNRGAPSKDGYRSLCKVCHREYSRKYYEEHKEQCLEVVKDYRFKNRAEVLQKQHEWYERNCESVKKKAKEWAENNPIKVTEYNRRKKARKRNQFGSFATWMIRYYRVVQQDTCFYCGMDISEEYQLEHMTPLSRGGLHCWTNTCLSCRDCNFRKHTKTLEEFVEESNEISVGFLA